MSPPPPLSHTRYLSSFQFEKRQLKMTDSLTSSLIATATAATNRLSHGQTVAAPGGGMLLRVNVGWTYAEEIAKKLSPLSGKDWPLRRNRYTSPQRQTEQKKKKNNKKQQEAFFAVSALWIEGNLSGLPLRDTET